MRSQSSDSDTPEVIHQHLALLLCSQLTISGLLKKRNLKYCALYIYIIKIKILLSIYVLVI